MDGKCSSRVIKTANSVYHSKNSAQYVMKSFSALSIALSESGYVIAVGIVGQTSKLLCLASYCFCFMNDGLGRFPVQYIKSIIEMPCSGEKWTMFLLTLAFV